MAVLDPSSCVSYHFTRKFEDSERQYTWDNGSTTFKFLPPCQNELLSSKTAHLDGSLRGRMSRIICSRNFKTVATATEKRSRQILCAFP